LGELREVFPRLSRQVTRLITGTRSRPIEARLKIFAEIGGQNEAIPHHNIGGVYDYKAATSRH
jgi:hypothetical protein